MSDKEKRYYTIEDIANELGVSKTTVSRAISGKGRIGKETVEKINRFIVEHNYRPNIIAKGLAQNRTYNLGVAMPSDFALGDLPFFQKCINGICKNASQSDYDVILFHISSNDLSQLKRIVYNNKVDGIILTRTMVDDFPVNWLKENMVPFIVVGSSDDKDVLHVDNDHVTACKTLTEMLLGRGCRSFALIGGNMEHNVSKNRLKGYQQALEEFDEDSQSVSILNVTTDIQVAKAVDDVLKNEIDCIVCMDDYICSRVISRLADTNMQVPGDVSVATLYRSILLEHSNLLITGLEFDAEKLGGIASQMLIDKLSGKDVEDYISTDYRLFIGNSTR